MRTLLMSTSLSTAALAALIACASGGVAAAQGAAPQAAPSQGAAPAANASAPGVATLGEVVVTAQKRAQRLQDVPQAVQAVSGAELRAAGVVEFTDLSKVAPSLVVRPAENPANASVSMRGVGTFAFSIGVEPSVAVQIDDVPVGFQPRAFTGLSDVERIEVLRGPQSTLYGKSASAGLINIITPGPTKTLTGHVDAMATGDGEYQVGAALAGPITDTLGFRVSMNYDDFAGNVKNLYDNQDVNGRYSTALNGKLVWKPVDKFQATLGLDYVDGSQTIGRPFVRLSPNADLRGNPAQPPSVWAPGVTPGPDNMDVSNNWTSGTNYDGLGESLKMSVDLDWATLMSITGHEFYFLKDRLDQDESSVASPDNRQDGRFTSEQYTQEFRLVSPTNQPFRYTLGLFYAGVDDTRDFVRGPYFSQAQWDATSGSQQEAAFGQADWEFLPGTTATAGVRVGHERVDYTFDDILNKADFAGASGKTYDTYKLALEHKFTRNIMTYLSYSTGYKGEAYDLSTGFNKNRQLAGPVQPETSGSWELGARTQFFDRRLTVNATLFDATYSNYQSQGIETLPDGTTNYRLANVGQIRTRGVELETAGQITEHLRVGVSGTYDDAIITSYPAAQCYPLQTATQGCVGSPSHQNLAGSAPPQAPKWKLAATFDYHRPIDGTPFEGLLQGIYSYQSRINYSLNQDPQTVQDGYGILNLSAGVRDPVHHYSIMVFVDNVTDQHYYAYMYNSTGNYGNQLATQVLPPRDFSRYAGVRLSYNF